MLVETNVTKVCSKCKDEKSIDDFHFRKDQNKHRNECKACVRERGKKYFIDNKEKIRSGQKEYYNGNKEFHSGRMKQYRMENKDKLKSYSQSDAVKLRLKGWRKENRENNIEKFKKRSKASYQKHKVKHRAAANIYAVKNKEKLCEARRKWERNKMATDVDYLLRKNLRSRIRLSLKFGYYKKDKGTEELIGCTIVFFKDYIQSLFKEGMSWANWGRGGWSLDHKIPVSWFNLENENCRKLAFHYTNMQPLFEMDNFKKNNKFYDPIHL